MTSTQTVATTYAERLLVAKNKQKATDDILRRMSKLRYKGHREPIPTAGKKKIIKLIRTRLTEGSAKAADKANYATIIAYMLEHVGDEGE